MRVVQLNTSDAGAGAEQVARDLHASLTQTDVTSSLLVGRVSTDRTDAIPIRYALPFEQRMSAIAENLLSLQGVLYPSTLNLHRAPPIRDCDIVHLHNAHGEYLNTAGIAALSRHKPMVWTLHDQWAFTGKCVYSDGCDRWQEQCGQCPILETPPRLRRDRTALLLRYKKWAYRRADFCLVCPSLWMRSAVERSHLASFRTEHIPNGIDTEIFTPRPKSDAKAATGVPLGLPSGIFVSADIHSDYKGFDHLEASLDAIYGEIFLSLVGRNRRSPIFGDRSQGVEVGFVASRAELANHLAAANFSIMPSKDENHSLSALESMACGTPVIAFRSGGLPEQVVHGETGLLVEAGDRRALVEAIRFLADNPDRCAEMGRNAARLVAREFTRGKMAQRYRDLYDREIERNRL